MIQVTVKQDQYEAFDPVQGCERHAYTRYIEISKDNMTPAGWACTKAFPYIETIEVTSKQECDTLILMLQQARRELWENE